MGRLAEARRRRQARAALGRADLPEPVRVHLSTPRPPDRLPWRQVTYTVLDLETTGLDPATDAIVAAGGLRVLGGRAAAATAFRLLVRPDRQVPTAAIRIHGLLPGELAAAPPLAVCFMFGRRSGAGPRACRVRGVPAGSPGRGTAGQW